MKKYIVHVIRNEKSELEDVVLAIKCKNAQELEKVIQNRIADFKDLKGYEYEECKRHCFKKNEPIMLIGTWVGAGTFQGE